MQNQDSLRWGLRLANALGPPTGKLAPAAISDGTLEKSKPGNPWRDEFGRFTDEAHAIFNVNAKLPPAELEARAKAYEEQADKRRRKAELDGIEGLKKGFLHYTPKGMQSGDESPEWHKLNRAVGKAEAVANEYLDRYRAAGEGLTEEGSALINYWLANASALRDMSRILAGKRDGGDAPSHKHDAPAPPVEAAEEPAMAAVGVGPEISESPEGDEEMGKALSGILSPFFPLSSTRNLRPTPTHRWLAKQSGFPDFIQEAFDVIDEQENGNGDSEFSAEHATRAKAYVVNNAVQVGLLDRKAANEILSAIGAEEVQEEPE